MGIQNATYFGPYILLTMPRLNYHFDPLGLAALLGGVQQIICRLLTGVTDAGRTETTEKSLQNLNKDIYIGHNSLHCLHLDDPSPWVFVNDQTDVLHSQNRSKIVGIIAVSNEYTTKILGQDVNIHPLFGL